MGCKGKINLNGTYFKKMSEVILEVQSLYKKFSRTTSGAIKSALKRSFRKAFFLNAKSLILNTCEFWALKNISFNLKEGEVLGLVGVNGSGKTTLLKCLCGLLEPDSGSIYSKGRIVGLFATGAGFNPSLSGYENIRLYLTLLGLSGEMLSRQAIAASAFSELTEEDLKRPVRTYSSGMKARLGFACVINSKPKVLIIDEALAVGDLRFRKKCYQEIASLKRSRVSFIIVSHSSSVILSHCDRVIFLKKGLIVADGNAQEIVDLYEEDLFLPNNMIKEADPIMKDDEYISLVGISFVDFSGNKLTDLPFNEDSTLRVRCVLKKSIEKSLSLKIICRELAGDSRILFFKVIPIELKYEQAGAPEVEIDVRFAPIMLFPGLYTLKVFITTDESFEILAAQEGYRFKVLGNRSEQGVYFQKADIENVRWISR
jgi:lipopolysaccharide transport system ATP-binding protein